jgi:hypothetical protein
MKTFTAIAGSAWALGLHSLEDIERWRIQASAPFSFCGEDIGREFQLGSGGEMRAGGIAMAYPFSRWIGCEIALPNQWLVHEYKREQSECGQSISRFPSGA